MKMLTISTAKAGMTKMDTDSIVIRPVSNIILRCGPPPKVLRTVGKEL